MSARWLTTRSYVPRSQVKQLFILCLMRMAEPIAFTVIFPFIANVSLPHQPVRSGPASVHRQAAAEAFAGG